MTKLFQFCPKIEKVVQLAVIDKNDTAVLAGHWLVPCRREVNYAEPIVGECDVALPIVEVSSIVGSAMFDRVGHRDQLCIIAREALSKKPSTYSAHKSKEQKSLHTSTY